MANALYLNLPAWAQNIALSIYGANLYKQRFSGSLPEIYKDNLDLFESPKEKHYHKQNIRLKELLTHCKNFVPYYDQYLRDIDISNITPNSLKDILPVLTKTDVMKHSSALRSTAPYFNKKLRTANTSGSSGSPLSINYTNESRKINYHFYETALNKFNCSYRSKSTTFAGRILYKNTESKPARYDFYNKTQYLSSYFISPLTIKDYVDALNSWQPEFIDSYPSAIYELVKLADQENLKFNFSPKCILTSSETLTGEQRTEIEKAFNTTVIDHYSCTEMSINAFSTGKEYFASPLYSVIELEHQFENSYSIITTGLLNFGMPLLRYKIGDVVEKSSHQSNYIFKSVEGRIDDIIVTPEGKKIGRMDPAFKNIQGIKLAQIIQEAKDLITVLIVLDTKNYFLFREDLLIESIKARTSNKIHVQIKHVPDISKGANGKFKSVISKVKQ